MIQWWFLHAHRPLSASVRCSGVRAALWRGPRGDAAVICAASPMLTALSGSSPGPSVWQVQIAHRYPDRWAMIFFVPEVKSSRLLAAMGGITLREQTISTQTKPASMERQLAMHRSKVDCH